MRVKMGNMNQFVPLFLPPHTADATNHTPFYLLDDVNVCHQWLKAKHNIAQHSTTTKSEPDSRTKCVTEKAAPPKRACLHIVPYTVGVDEEQQQQQQQEQKKSASSHRNVDNNGLSIGVAVSGAHRVVVRSMCCIIIKFMIEVKYRVAIVVAVACRRM